jgi:phosphate transport system permease protein
MVPREQRLGSAALGFSQTRMFLSVLLPLSMPGLIVGLVLSIGRALAETAALIFTSGYVDRFPHSVLDSGRTLSIHIYDLTMNVPGGDQNAYASALALVVLLLIIDTTAVWVSERLMHRTVIPL